LHSLTPLGGDPDAAKATFFAVHLPRRLCPWAFGPILLSAALWCASRKLFIHHVHETTHQISRFFRSRYARFRNTT